MNNPAELPGSSSAEKYPQKLEFAKPTKFNAALSALWDSEGDRANMSIDSNFSTNLTLQIEAMTTLVTVQKNQPENTRETLSQIKRDFMKLYSALGQMLEARSPNAKPLSIFTYIMQQAGEHFEAFQQELLLDALVDSVSLEKRVLELTEQTKDGVEQALNPIDADPNSNFGAY